MKISTKFASLLFAAMMSFAATSNTHAQAAAGTVFGVSTATAISVGIVGALAISAIVDDAGDNDDIEEPVDTSGSTSST